MDMTVIVVLLSILIVVIIALIVLRVFGFIQPVSKQNDQINLMTTIDPLKTKMSEIESMIRSFREKELVEQVTLKQEFEKIAVLHGTLQTLNNSLSLSSNKQGKFGEEILERILIANGFQKNVHYFVHGKGLGLKNQDDNSTFPDFVIQYSKDQYIAIDSKFSIKAYLDYCSARNDLDKKRYAEDLYKAVKQKISDLAKKEYTKALPDRSVEFTLMFIPHEEIYIILQSEKEEIILDAFKLGIIIITPTTLMVVLKMILQMWRNATQAENVQKIIKECQKIVDKVEASRSLFDTMKKDLVRAEKSIAETHSKLFGDHNSIMKIYPKLSKLGLKTPYQGEDVGDDEDTEESK